MKTDWQVIVENFFEKDNLILDIEAKKEARIKLSKIDKKNRLYISETGDNRLFLALGFLNYFDKDKQLLAPLILIPVYFDGEHIKSSFVLKKYSSDSKFNITLLEKLKREFNIEIPELEKLPKDQSGLDVNKIFYIVDKKIKSLNDQNWFIDKEQCFLSLFSFKKILMYKDIENLKSLESHPILNSLDNPKNLDYIQNLRDKFKDNFVEEKELDNKIEQEQLYCPLSYDSSQLQAILHTRKGDGFVLQGPPGTGKSQTIANIISQLLAEGKKVLFIAEKRVALDVVEKRLKNSSLEQFALELHSDKSKKREVAKKLLKNYNTSILKPIIDWNKKCLTLTKVRDELNKYIHFIHEKQISGLTAFSALSTIISSKSKCCDLEFDLQSSNQFNEKDLENIKEIVNKIQGAIHDLDCKLSNHSLNGIKMTWNPILEKDLETKINSILKKLETLTTYFDLFFEKFSVQPIYFIDQKNFYCFLKILDHISNIEKQYKTYNVVFYKKFREIKKNFEKGLSWKKYIDSYTVLV